MTLEEGFGIDIADDEAERIATAGDLNIVRNPGHEPGDRAASSSQVIPPLTWGAAQRGSLGCERRRRGIASRISSKPAHSPGRHVY